MADTPNKVREVAWRELFPWLLLLRSVRIALMVRVLVLGAAGLFATMVGWWVIAEMFSRSTDAVVTSWPHGTGLAMWVESTQNAAAPSWLNTSARSAGEVFESAGSHLVEAPRLIWAYFTRPFVSMFNSKLSPTGFLFLLLCGVWELVVWGLFGGAITRIAALKFTRDEAPGLISALKHAASKWPSYSLPPLIALAGAAVFGIQLVLLGLIMRIEVLAFLAALIWPFVILLGLMMAILLIGALVGWPFMWSTVSVEGTDAFDALSRSYAYTYHRPWRLLWYALFAVFLAIVSMFVVKLFASSAIALGNWSIDWGLDNKTMRTVVAPERAPSANEAPKTEGAPTSNAATPSTATITESPRLPDADGAPKIEGVPAPDATASAADTTENAQNSPETPGRFLAGTKSIIGFWKAVVAMLVAGYEASFLWVASVGIYLLLRRDIDGVQTSEVYIDQTEEYGMPPLSDDGATGVPEVAVRENAVPGDSGM